MDPQQLVAVLSYTFSPDQAQRAQAETAIKSLPTVDGAPQALLQIVGVGEREQVAREVRQAAAIAFKNIAKSHWEPFGRITPEQCVPAAAKPVIRDLLFQVLLVESDKSVRDLLAESVNQIARVDYPQHWPQLLPECLSFAQSGDPLRMHNALLALRQVAKRLEYKQSGADRAPLETIVSTALPLLQALMRSLLVEARNYTLEAALIMKLVLKILWSCTQFALPAGAQGGSGADSAAAGGGGGGGGGGSGGDGVDPAMLSHLGGWLDLIGGVVALPLPEAAEAAAAEAAGQPPPGPPGQPTTAEERQSWPWWKLKKWALQILARWFHRYGMPGYALDEAQAFAKVFSEQFAPKLLEPVLQLLFLPRAGRFCAPRCAHLALTFVESAVQLQPTWVLLKPHMLGVLTDAAFPHLCLSDAHLDLFETDPLEFVRLANDPMGDFTDPKMSAMTLLETAAKQRKKHCLDPFLGFLVETLNEYAAVSAAAANGSSAGAAPSAAASSASSAAAAAAAAAASASSVARCARRKDGALVALCCLAPLLKKQRKYAAQLEPLLVGHVFPEFHSPLPFLRARAASMVPHYYDVAFSDFGHVAALVQHTVHALSADPCIPVQVEAANGLRCLVELDGTEALLLPILPDLLNQYFRIMGEIGNDTVVSALEAIINKFGDDILPHAALLIRKLAESFLTYAQDGASAEDDEACMAASQCVEAISTVLHTVFEASGHSGAGTAGAGAGAGAGTAAALLREVQPHLLPLLGLVLGGSEGAFLEYLESALEILTFVTYYADVKPQGGSSEEAVAAARQAAHATLAPYLELFPLMAHAFHAFAYDYLPNMMSPVDNLVGYATDLFLNASEPSSGQTYVAIMLGMVEKVFTNGVRASDRETVCASHLLLSLLHNCHGRVDAAVPTVLGLVFGRLNPPPRPTPLRVLVPPGHPGGPGGPPLTVTHGGGAHAYTTTVACPPGAVAGAHVEVTVEVPPEEVSPKLRASLLMVVASAFFYNARLVLAWLEQTPNRTGAFFQAWFAEMAKSGGDWPHLAAKLHCLALSALLALPPDQLPQVVREGLPTIIAQSVRFLTEIEEANKEDDAEGEAEKEEDEDDEDDEDEYEDDDDEEEEGDRTNNEELEYLKSLKDENKKIMKLALDELDEADLYGGDEDDDEGEYSSPIDGVDELQVFFASLQAGITASPAVFGAAQGALPAEVQTLCTALLHRAHAKQQEAAAAAAAAAAAGS